MNFFVFSQLARNFWFPFFIDSKNSETSSHLTLPSSGESANHRFRRRFHGLDVSGSRPRTRVSTGEMGSLDRWRPSLLGLLVDLVELIQIFSRGDAG